jgi:hypothetical protein
VAELGAQAFDFVHEIKREAERGCFQGELFTQVFDAAESMQAFVVV